MKKRNYIYGVVILVMGIGGGRYLTSLKPNVAVAKKNSIEDDLANSDNIPKLDWEMLNQFNYKTGKGPKELTEMNGKVIKIPGYVVPLSDNYSVLNEFLLVPDGQSCIHVPPPPPNLIVKVKLRNPIPMNNAWNPAWVTGVFKLEKSESEYGGSAYTMDAVKLEKF